MPQEYEENLPPRLRALAIVPAFCWLMNLLYNINITREVGVMMWLCHVTTLMLASGLALGLRGPIRMAAVFSTIDLPVWLIGVAATHVTSRASILSHICVPLVAWIALAAIRMDRRPLRVHLAAALAYLVIVQAVTRLVTAAPLNVNVVFRPYDFLTTGASVRMEIYWVATAALMMALYAGGILLFRAVFPPRPDFTALASPPSALPNDIASASR